MQQAEATLGDVVDAFCHSFGTDASRRIVVPSVLLTFGGQLGDVARRMGWAPPICSTALVELRRGVVGDPAPWMAATGIVPATLKERVAQRPASIQDKWFARLFLVKPLIFAALSVFWLLSGFIALFVSYEAAAAILVSHHFPAPLIAPVTIVSSLVDISIGALIAFRKTSAFGLVVGIGVAFGYMTGAALFTPDLWVEPLGALVKTGPAIVLMLVALLMLDNR